MGGFLKVYNALLLFFCVPQTPSAWILKFCTQFVFLLSLRNTFTKSSSPGKICFYTVYCFFIFSHKIVLFLLTLSNHLTQTPYNIITFGYILFCRVAFINAVEAAYQRATSFKWTFFFNRVVFFLHIFYQKRKEKENETRFTDLLLKYITHSDLELVLYRVEEVKDLFISRVWFILNNYYESLIVKLKFSHFNLLGSLLVNSLWLKVKLPVFHYLYRKHLQNMKHCKLYFS